MAVWRNCLRSTVHGIPTPLGRSGVEVGQVGYRHWVVLGLFLSLSASSAFQWVCYPTLYDTLSDHWE